MPTKPNNRLISVRLRRLFSNLHTKVLGPVSHGKEIRDTDIDQGRYSASSNALNCSARYNHCRADRQGAQETANKEGTNCKKKNRLAAPDVAANIYIPYQRVQRFH